jgi:predicted DNA-binding helix-hairpin-helix protein
MVKTFEQFSSGSTKQMYTPEEFQKVYDIVSEFYDGDDIEDFIYSTDVEEKEDFIMENEIETLRVCYTCGKFIREGYIYNDFETYCSDKCFIAEHGKATFDGADDDELYWTAWEG